MAKKKAKKAPAKKKLSPKARKKEATGINVQHSNTVNEKQHEEIQALKTIVKDHEKRIAQLEATSEIEVNLELEEGSEEFPG